MNQPARFPHPFRAAVAATTLVTALVGLAGCGAAGSPPDDGRRQITVAAASDLRFAFDELGESFTAETGVEVTFVYGSSGQLREQVVNGAPFDLFASANVAFVDDVIDAGRGVESTKADYAIGRIVLWGPPGRPPPETVHELASPEFRRIAIANPRHAPYGLAAEQALEAAGVLDTVGDRLVIGENISDAFRIVESGNADVGIVALSLAVVGDSPFVVIDDTLHAPLRQALVVIATGQRGDDAQAFAAHLARPEGREVMARYGFALPDDLPRSDEPARTHRSVR